MRLLGSNVIGLGATLLVLGSVWLFLSIDTLLYATGMLFVIGGLVMLARRLTTKLS
jgi:hypothetical protein